MNPGPEPPEHNTLWQTVQGVAASFFGVQSSKNRQRDFTRGRPGHFIAVALAMTLLVIGALWLVVKLVLRAAGL